MENGFPFVRLISRENSDMTLKDAIEKEIVSQGISAIDISKASGVSKATIYNILNSLTDDARIRPSTKRAIARGCGKDMRTLGDGGIEFFKPGSKMETPEPVNAAIRLRYVPGRPFFSNNFCQDAFDWLHNMETSGRIPPCDVVNRVFQRRPDFLSLVIENTGHSEVSAVNFQVDVSIPKSRLQRTFSFSGMQPTTPSRKSEITLFVEEANFDFDVEISRILLRDADGASCAMAWENETSNVYRFRRTDTGNK